jgi:hypothetical protein
MCIFGVVYVHAWTGLSSDPLLNADTYKQGMLRWGLVELLGRSAVPLLGMISGWLVTESALRSYGGFIAGKARTIFLPMALWNALAILLVAVPASFGFFAARFPLSAWWVLNELFCLTRPDDIDVQMPFLRDLFICMIVAPVLVRLRSRWLALIAAIVAAWVISGLALPLLLRPAILLFFIAGILARRNKLELRIASLPILMVAIPFILLAMAKIWLGTAGVALGARHPFLLPALDIPMRFAAAQFFWNAAWRVAASHAAAWLLRIEPYAFLMFCAHLIMIWLGGPFIGRLTGPLGAPLYPAYLLLQPLLVLGASLWLGRVLMRHAPSAAFLLSGGRLLRREKPQHLAAALGPKAS